MKYIYKNTLEDIIMHGGYCQNGISCKKCPFSVTRTAVFCYSLCSLSGCSAELKLKVCQNLLDNN